MEKKKETIVTCAITLVSTLLAGELSNLAARLIFIALSILTVILYFKGDGRENRGIQCFSYFLMAVLVGFIVVNDVFPEFPSRFFWWSGQVIHGEDVGVLTYKDIYQANLNSVNQSLESLQDNIGQTSVVLTELNDILEAEIISSRETYPSEVEDILKLIDSKTEVIDKDFPDITLNMATVELFYKTQFYDTVYHYSSIIGAFEKYGIHCSNLKIDEYTLALWDLENLYLFFNMKKELEPDLAENKWYEKKNLSFNSNKVDLNQYSDFLDYKEWRFTYTEKNAQELDDIFMDFILNFYKRLHLNFTR